MSQAKSILWVDDEIEMLKPHILFLEERGYKVTPVSNGEDAISMVQDQPYDMILLDQMMPGKDGLETLQEVRSVNATIPIVMVTKNEEEHVMDAAIGRQADDYLLKPINPTQVLSAVKRILEKHRITESQVARDYVSQFQSMNLSNLDGLSAQGWIDTYLRMISWDIQLDRYRETGLSETHEDQKRNANYEFSRFVEKNYQSWLKGADGPELSPQVFENNVLPRLQAGKQVAFIVIDCMRLDQWVVIEPLLEPFFRIDRRHYYGILPSATPYARNALFAGMFPLEILQNYPQYWDDSKSEHSLNRFERELMQEQLKRLGVAADRKMHYEKVFNSEEASALLRTVQRGKDIDLFALVFNFIDILTHGRSESSILQEIAPDEAAFRTLARSWFEHSPLFEMMKRMASRGMEIFVTTDHGSVLGKRPTIATGNRDTSTNVRYKYGENLGHDSKGSFKMEEPEEFMLPKARSTMNFIIAKENYYFVYPTKYRQYEKQFQGSFQHGGVSLEELILPVAHLVPR